MRIVSIAVVLVACGGSPKGAVAPKKTAADADPDGPHRAAIAAQVQPMIDADVANAIVIGVYDAGKLEIYGFGKGPGGVPPTGKTLFEIGSVTKVFTSLLFADSIQHREVTLDTPVAELLPPGVTMPVRDKIAITLGHLALHSSGLPRLPPSIQAHPDSPDPYGHYNEDALYADLVATALDNSPGTKIVYSNYGVGLLGFALGRKIGGGYATVLRERVLVPLGLTDTYLTVPAAAQARRAAGTITDLAPVAPWTFDALAGAGGLVSTARDQLALIDAELDAAATSEAALGSSKLPLRAAMRLTQESRLEHDGDNEGLGWQIDPNGRYWHNGGTGGYRAFLGFDPKTRRGVVILASTSISLVDHLADILYKLLDNEPVKPPTFPTEAQLAPFVGSYDLGGMKLAVVTAGKRVYIEGPGAPRYRLVPISDHEFWIEQLQSVMVFQREGDKVMRAVFVVGEQQMIAPRVDAAPATGTAPPPAPQ